MEMREIRCENCGKQIVVGNEYIREQMYCTLDCMFTFEEKEK